MSIEAGADLDARLAEAMGLKARVVVSADFVQERYRAEVWRPRHPGAHGQTVGLDGNEGWYPCPAYFTEATAAISAAEEMRKAGRIDTWGIESRDKETCAWVVASDRERLLWGNSPAHALSLALLEALEGSK